MIMNLLCFLSARNQCWLWLLLYSFFCIKIARALIFTFQVGAVIEDGEKVCTGIADAHLGYKFAVDRMNGVSGSTPLSEQKRRGLVTQMFIKDAEGNEHRVSFNYTRVAYECAGSYLDNFALHQGLMSDLVNQTHFLFGSSPVQAGIENDIAHKARKLLYHCCVTPDAYYAQDTPYIFGAPASNSKYTLQALKSMALAGGVRKLFVFYLEDNEFTESTCLSAVQYVNDVVVHLAPDFQIVGSVKYNADKVQVPNFIEETVVEEAVRLGAEAIIGCDGERTGHIVAEALADRGVYLKSLFLTVAPARKDFVATVGPRAAENVLSAVQWHPSMGYADSFFGTSAGYTSDFEAVFGTEPSYLAAMASATVFSLAVAIKGAFERCTFTQASMDADALLFDTSAIACKDAIGQKYLGNGYDLIRKSLEVQSLETVVGRIEFNQHRRNVAKEPAITQIQSGVLECVMPLEFANKAIVMPMPAPPMEEESSQEEHIGDLPRDAFIIVVVVILGVALLLAVGVVLLLQWRIRHTSDIFSQLHVPLDQLDIIHPPERLADGSWESGKAKFCSSLVSLEPLSEIRTSASMATAQVKHRHPLSVSSKDAVCEALSLEASSSAEVSVEVLDQEDPPQSMEKQVLSSKLDMGVNFVHGNTLNLKPHTTPHMAYSQVLSLVWQCQRLQHPSIVPVLGASLSLPSMPPGMAVLITECQELGSLSSVMEMDDLMVLDIVKQLDVAKDIAQALAYLHTKEDPNLGAVLPNKLSGVSLNKYCRAKVHVPLTALVPDSGKITKRQSRFGWGASQASSPSRMSKQGVQEARVKGPSAGERADVLQYGLGVVDMLAPQAASQPHSEVTSGSYSELRNLSPSSSSGSAQGLGISTSQLHLLQSRHCPALIELLCQCCNLDAQQRPSFAQVFERLELHSLDIVHAAQQAPSTTPSFNPMQPPRQSADELLYDLFPAQVADALKSGRLPDPEPYPCVSLFFSDIVGYTELCSKLSPLQVMAMLHRLYMRFDQLAQELDLFKVETIGDAYMCVANLRSPQPECHAALMAAFAFGCRKAANEEFVCPSQPELGCIHIRCGIHAGPVMGAVVGTLNRRYCLFGDTVNVASRMESTSVCDNIQCSATFMQLLQQQWPEAAGTAQPQGERAIKGKGNMETFFLYPPSKPWACGNLPLNSGRLKGLRLTESHPGRSSLRDMHELECVVEGHA
uniref:guanylate cyclase n=3 Tax=Dunaliella tertiolecta TaxID=3047 RepID=A0A7S3VSS8_DUNTE